MNEESLASLINRLLNNSNIDLQVDAVVALEGGKNNRLHKLAMSDGSCLVLKRYFQHPNDLRNRQNSESFFYDYAAKIAAMYVPRLIVADPLENASLFEYIDGFKITTGCISREEVQVAIDFINKLNTAHNKIKAENMPNASEACFSINEHLELINSRVNRLLDIKHKHSNVILKKTIEDVSLYWEKIKKKVICKVNAYDLDINSRLMSDDRCISPSDFGFHNAIKRINGGITFIDFEYAGWDDPAKLVGDFFSQVEVPISKDYSNFFIKSIAGNFLNQKDFEIRATLLMPAYQLKWCCIALNVFLPENFGRRLFSNPLISPDQYLHHQIDKANSLLRNIKKGYEQY